MIGNDGNNGNHSVIDFSDLNTKNGLKVHYSIEVI